MKKYLKITPEGTKDFLFEECTAFADVCSKIQNVFEEKAYRQVITPCIEFYDLFSLECSGIPQKMMFKTTDNKGRILVMRPDSTLPIARMASTRLKNHKAPIRVFYRQAVYHNNPTLTGRYNEVMQMGIELLGVKGREADFEVISTAIESLGSVVPEFRFEIGHANFFKAIINDLNATDDKKEDIRVAMENRNYTLLNQILDSLDETPVVNVLRKLPRLFGGEEILDKAYSLCINQESRNSVDYIKDLYNELKDKFPKKNIAIDLGLVQRNEYYSGIVFCGYVEGAGDTVLSGGRYDKLLDSFDCPMGASGFAINADALVDIVMEGK